jgi:tripartite-type tricarboxylate transporter receptor subunit TctC
MLTRRQLLTQFTAAGLSAFGLGCRGARRAGACPALANRRIRWIVPNAAGGGYDTDARLLQPLLERRLGAQIVIENLAGAGGLIGARAIAEAAPDGLTVGIAGMPGLLVSVLLGESGVPDPARAFTILCRIARSAHVWATGSTSPLHSIEDALTAGRERALVFAINEVGSASFVSVTVSAALSHVQAALVPGFSGTRAASLAAARGDVDLVCFDFDTIRPLIASGELRPLLQLGPSPDSDELLSGTPLLSGPKGLADRVARTIGESDTDARQLAMSLAHVIGSGRVVVAPRGVASEIADCFSSSIRETLKSEGLPAAATRAFDFADMRSAQADVEAAAREAAQLRPLLEPALAKLRG